MILINGQASSSVDADNRGLAFGDGLFETIKVSDGRPEFLALHIRRLKLGAQRLGIKVDLHVVQQDVNALLAENIWSSAILKVIVTRAAAERGYKPSLDVGSDRIISLAPYSDDCSARQTDGVNIRLCDMRLGINPALAGMKHLARLENVLARSEWSDSTIGEGILLDTSGHVIEGTMSNVFMISGGQLYTPALQRCGVEGVLREVIIDTLAEPLGIGCNIKDLTVDHIYRAEEMFVCNSVIGIWPVTGIGCHKKKVGPVTMKLQHALRVANK